MLNTPELIFKYIYNIMQQDTLINGDDVYKYINSQGIKADKQLAYIIITLIHLYKQIHNTNYIHMFLLQVVKTNILNSSVPNLSNYAPQFITLFNYIKKAFHKLSTIEEANEKSKRLRTIHTYTQGLNSIISKYDYWFYGTNIEIEIPYTNTLSCILGVDNQIVVGDISGYVQLIEENISVWRTEVFKHTINDNKISGDKKWIACVAWNDGLKILNRENGSIESQIPIDNLSEFTFVDNDKLVLGMRDGLIEIRDLTGNIIVTTLIGHTDKINCIVINNSIISGSEDGTIRKWNPDQIISTQEDNPVRCIALFNNIIIGGYMDGTIRIYFKHPLVLTGHTASVNCIITMKVGSKTLIVSGFFDGTIKIWDISMENPLIATLEGHTQGITKLATLPSLSGKYDLIISGTYSEGQRIWDLYDPQNPFILTEINSRDFTILSNNKIVSTYENRLKIWE